MSSAPHQRVPDGRHGPLLSPGEAGDEMVGAGDHVLGDDAHLGRELVTIGGVAAIPNSNSVSLRLTLVPTVGVDARLSL